MRSAHSAGIADAPQTAGQHNTQLWQHVDSHLLLAFNGYSVLISAMAGCPGTIKRYGMKRGPMTHGSKSHREHGSTGPGTTPGRTFPGLKMAGHMGAQRRKSRSLQVGTEICSSCIWAAVPKCNVITAIVLL